MDGAVRQIYIYILKPCKPILRVDCTYYNWNRFDVMVEWADHTISINALLPRGNDDEQ